MPSLVWIVWKTNKYYTLLRVGSLLQYIISFYYKQKHFSQVKSKQPALNIIKSDSSNTNLYYMAWLGERVYIVNTLARSQLGYSQNRSSIVYKHWPDTPEFLTRTVELWYKWIRLSCYYNTIYNACQLYTHVTPIL